MLLVVSPRQTPPMDTSWLKYEYITQAVDTNLQVWLLEPYVNTK
jgi:hypothetical protein